MAAKVCMLAKVAAETLDWRQESGRIGNKMIYDRQQGLVNRPRGG
jgi:hypothetical protein